MWRYPLISHKQYEGSFPEAKPAKRNGQYGYNIDNRYYHNKEEKRNSQPHTFRYRIDRNNADNLNDSRIEKNSIQAFLVFEGIKICIKN